MNTYNHKANKQGYQKKVAIYALIIIVAIFAVIMIVDVVLNATNNQSAQPQQEQVQVEPPKDEQPSEEPEEEPQEDECKKNLTPEQAAQKVQELVRSSEGAENTNFNDTIKNCLAKALEHYLQDAGLPQDSLIEVASASVDGSGFKAEFTINNTSVTCSYQGGSMTLNGAGITTTYKVDTHLSMDAENTAYTSPLNTSAMASIIGEDHAKILADEIQKYCDENGYDAFELYTSNNDKSGVSDQNDRKVFKLYIYDAQTNQNVMIVTQLLASNALNDVVTIK